MWLMGNIIKSAVECDSEYGWFAYQHVSYSFTPSFNLRCLTYIKLYIKYAMHWQSTKMFTQKPMLRMSLLRRNHIGNLGYQTPLWQSFCLLFLFYLFRLHPKQSVLSSTIHEQEIRFLYLTIHHRLPCHARQYRAHIQ